MGSNSSRNVVELIADGVRIRVRGDGPWVSQQVEDLLSRLSKRHEPPAARAPARPTLLKDLLAARTWKTHGDVAAIVAYHLQTEGGRAAWRSGEIVLELRKAAYPLPGNITDALTHRKKQGYFETQNRMWHLTERGIRWVQQDLLGPHSFPGTSEAEPIQQQATSEIVPEPILDDRSEPT